jgi:HTH-type transcriptional regulator / antitoxin HigA
LKKPSEQSRATCSCKELAKRTGRPLNAINEIINGKKAITAETALQLEEVMPDILARFWLNLETGYQLTMALIKKRSKSQLAR